MKKYWSLLRYEMKTILKDPMNVFMLVYPIMMLLIAAYALPAILDTVGAGTGGEAISLLITFSLILALGGFLMGAMLGFSLLDNKDENTLINIAASPIRVSGYAGFKIIYSFALAVIANLIMLGGLKLLASDAYTVTYFTVTVRLLDGLSWLEIIAFSVVSALLVPSIALLIAAVAKNKIEGFAFMKGGGIVIFIPVLSLLEVFQDGKQYLLGIVPIFWPLKAILNDALHLTNDANAPFWVYMLVGAVYAIALGGLALRGFLKKINVR
jgi:fluoroquinolone transport system permease protein